MSTSGIPSAELGAQGAHAPKEGAPAPWQRPSAPVPRARPPRSEPALHLPKCRRPAPRWLEITGQRKHRHLTANCPQRPPPAAWPLTGTPASACPTSGQATHTRQLPTRHLPQPLRDTAVSAVPTAVLAVCTSRRPAVAQLFLYFDAHPHGLRAAGCCGPPRPTFD